jgi:pimeloyl-ACP methyl ester carboxylesterase
VGGLTLVTPQPFTSKVHRTLVRHDVRLAVTDWGGDAPPAVLIHGLDGNQQVWDAVAVRLAPQCRVVTYDLRCHGSSTGSADHSWSAFVADLKAVLDELDLHDVTLVGHSIGAGMALQVAVANEHCRTLALLDGAFPVPEPRPGGGRLALLHRAVVMFSTRIVKGPASGNHSLSSFNLRKVGNDYRGRHSDFDTALRSVECPTTLILGSQMEEGRDGPAFQLSRQGAATRAMQSNPRIHVQWIEARHDMIITKPQEVVDAIIRLQALG